MHDIIKQFKTGIILIFIVTVITGLFYPFLITGLAQFFFPWQANGSFVKQHDEVIGSLLIGQSFTSNEYFWSRPSATTPFPYNPENSSGSNLSMTNPAYIAAVKQRIETIHKSDNANHQLIPIDLVTSSASGLDPEISPLAALYQVPRIAKARGISEKQVQAIIQSVTQYRTLNLLGESRVNVLLLNLALNQLSATQVTRRTTE